MLIRSFIFSLSLILFLSCSAKTEPESPAQPDLFIEVLGIAQDAGFPQAGCTKANCQLFWNGQTEARHVVSLGLVDATTKQSWMFEATPDFKHQFHHLNEIAAGYNFSGIFLTHAHIGHYTGLMQLGHEAMGASDIPVYAMPRMKTYLETHGPWSQLVDFNNIALQPLAADSSIQISESLKVTPFLVPHRDEYSETVGYRIESANKKVLFIPDINKWDVWERSIVDEIAKVDVALIDATFFDSNELPGRDMSQIPHPFVEESIALFGNLPDSEKAKITFIHFNHTNPLILNSMERAQIENMGYNVAFEGMRVGL